MKVLKRRSFRMLCYATVISSLGDSLYSLACTLTVYAISGSLMGVAGMWLIRALIRIPSQFISGIITDRFNRKHVSVMIYAISSIFVLMFVGINQSQLAVAFVLIFILQGTSDIDNMAQTALLPEILEKEELQDANSIFHVLGMVIMMVGPGIGGILYKFVGSNVLYIIDAITFVIAAFIMAALPYQKVDEPKKEIHFSLFAFAKEGMREVKKVQILRIIILTNIFFGIMGRFYEIDKVYMADVILDIGAEGIIFFSYAMSIGSLLAPIVLKIVNKKKESPIKNYAIISAFSVLSYIIWSMATNLPVSMVANLFLGVFSGCSSIYVNLILQKNVDNQYLGRVMSFNKICLVLSAIIGIILAPVLVEVIGVSGSMICVGIISLICIFDVLYSDRKRMKQNAEC